MGTFATLAVLLVVPATHGARSTVPTFRLSDAAQSDSAKAVPVLDRVTGAFKSLKLLTADFVQIVQNPMTGAPDTTRGKLYQLPPNRFGMRFTAPRGDRLVADGRYLWIYTPSTTPNQVIRAKLQTAGGAAAPNLLGQFADRPHERYRSRYVKAEKGVDVITLVPLEKDAPFTEATLAVDSSGIPRRLEFEESSGQRRVLMLSGIALNGNVDFREFTFSVPAGVQVVDQ